MSDQLFNRLQESVRQAGAIRRGQRKPSRTFTYGPMDVRALRESVDASQAEFAMMIGVSKDTVQNWEQGRRSPKGAARALLRVFEKNPKIVREALA